MCTHGLALALDVSHTKLSHTKFTNVPHTKFTTKLTNPALFIGRPLSPVQACGVCIEMNMNTAEYNIVPFRQIQIR
jgi:hypothetical protein